MDFGELRRQQQESARLMTYQNSGYNNERVSKQTLLVYLDDSTGGTNVLSGPNDFSIKLTEPLRIDTLSEVYLDLFVTSSSSQHRAQE